MNVKSLIAENLFSLLGAGFLLLLDVVMFGSFLISIVVCPFWFLVSFIRNGILKSGGQFAFFRIAIPAVTLGIALGTTFIQWGMADANGERVVRACEAFYSDTARYPEHLSELVPKYLPSVPRAKYSMDGDFYYYNSTERPPILWWNKFGLCHKIYSFERKEWGYLD
jgi:hypothetical protein